MVEKQLVDQEAPIVSIAIPIKTTVFSIDLILINVVIIILVDRAGTGTQIQIIQIAIEALVLLQVRDQVTPVGADQVDPVQGLHQVAQEVLVVKEEETSI